MPEEPTNPQASEFAALLDVSRRLGATTELTPLLEQVVFAATGVLNCERGTVFLYDGDQHELFSRTATGAGDIRFSADRGIAGACVRTGAVINVPDAYADPRFNRDIDRQTGFRTRNMLAFPLRNHAGELVGVLQVLNKRGGEFTAHDEDLATVLSSLAGVAVQRQILIEEYTEKQKLERDLALARHIQQSSLPRSVPTAAGYDIAGFNDPADATGGDCFDYVRYADGRVGLLIADASGHGIGPALVVSQCRAMIRALMATGLDLATVMAKVNTLLMDDLPDGMFITAFVGVLDPGRGRVEYVSAGHGPLLIHRRASDEAIELGATTVPAGVLDDLELDGCEEVDLAAGDTLLLMTDGFFEWMNPETEQFGTARVFEVVRRLPDAGAADLIAAIRSDLRAFVEGMPQKDDLTAIVVRRR